jgi:hypothetical protein
MLKTTEEIKKAVLDYLTSRPRRTKQVEEYTASRISEIIKANISQVEDALAELTDEDLVDSRRVQLDVYVPNNEEGFKVLTVIAEKGYMIYSTYWAVFFGFALLFIGFLLLGSYLSVPSQITDLFVAYHTGILYGIAGSFIAAFFGGYIIQYILTKFRRWQIVSEETYETLSSLVKYTIYLFVPSVGIYYLVSRQFGYSFELGVVATLLGIAIAASFGYKQLMKQKRGNKRRGSKSGR